MLNDIKNENLKGLDVYTDTVNETIDIMNKYRVAPAAGMSGSHTTRTSSSVQFEQGQGHSAAELRAITTVTGSNGKTITDSFINTFFDLFFHGGIYC